MTEQPNPDIDRLIDLMIGLLQPLLRAMDAFEYTARHLHPPNLTDLAAGLTAFDQPLQEGLAAFRAADWPDHLTTARTRLEDAASFVHRGLEGMREAATSPDGTLLAYRAVRQAAKAQEAIYPLATALAPVSQFFLEPEQRQDEALLARLQGAVPDPDGPGTGIIHADNEKGSRGGFSLYVPEYYDSDRAWPLVMALHGGSGHGRDFLWSWLRSARSHGAIVVSPTARGDTWALMGPDIDSQNIQAMLAYVQKHWNVDDTRLLLTGMSDGGTFAYVSGLQGDSPFTHLAPTSASFHPMLLEMSNPARLQGLPIYLTHGALDWMFPIDMARMARDSLSAAGAKLEYREIADLSHTYPRDEDARILDWLGSS